MERASGCNLWSAVAAKRNVFCQYLSDGYCKPGPPSPCLSLHGRAPQISPVIPVRGDPSGLSGKHPTVLGELNFYFGFLLLPFPLHPPKAIGPGAISCGPVIIQKWAMQLECRPSSYLCNAFLFGLCGSKGVPPPRPLGSGIFTIVTCLSTYLVRGRTLGTTYLDILIHDFLIFSSDCWS